MDLDVARTRVTSADFVRHFGQWQEQAAVRPVYVTHHGRDRLVMVSLAAYMALRARAPAASGPPSLEPMLEQLAEGFVALDREYRITEINPAAAAYLRLTRSAAAGQRLEDQVPALQGSLLMGHLVRAGSTGEIVTAELPSPTFERRMLRIQAFPYRDGAGCLLRDVSGEIDARRHADTMAATLTAIATHGGLGRARLSPRGTFVEVDSALADMAGFLPDALLKARLTDILPLNRRVGAARELELVLERFPIRRRHSRWRQSSWRTLRA